MNPEQETDLEQLLRLPNIWQASRIRRSTAVVTTGYPALDAQLHHGGWPDGATTEILLPQVGIGELRLLIPALRRVQRQRPWLVFIAPPHQPFAAALLRQGINPAGVLMIQPRSEKDFLWCAEQVLQSGCCGAVISWAMQFNLQHQQLRRLQQAAHRGQCWHTLLRPMHCAAQASASALRLQLESSAANSSAANSKLQVQILKQRGGWGGQRVSLSLTPDLTQLQMLSAAQLPLPIAQTTQRPLPARIADQQTHGPSVVSLPVRQR